MSLTVRSEPYKLKYNEKTNQLRDLTWEELKITYGKGSKIECPCMNREYNVAQSFIAQHMKCQKHRNWLENEQRTYNKEYGHCGNSEDIINTLYKQLRENKIMYHNLNKSKKEYDEKIENEVKQLKENLKSKIKENEILLLEMKSLDEYIQKINLLLEIKSLENDITKTKSNIIIKKRK